MLTLQEAADALGVHYMTVYRYVRLGLLPATKVGGTWQVRADDLESYRASAEVPVAGRAKRRAPWAARLEARLIAGDAAGAWGVIEASLAAGADIEEIYLDLITPAMTGIGERWAAGEVDVSVEHRATGIAFRLIGRLGPRFARKGRTRGAVLVGAPSGERHALPVALLADLLRGEGWEVSDLGADLPHESFVQAARALPDLVGIGVSVTAADNVESAAELLAALRDGLEREVYLAIGGLAVRDAEHAEALGAHAWAPTAHAFAAQLTDRSR